MSGAVQLSADDFPGYAAAVARENIVRAAACLGLPEIVCGLKVRPMSIEHVRLLGLASSPFLLRGIQVETLCDKPGIENDVLTALWIISLRFRAGNIRARDKFLRSKPVLKIMRLPIDQPVRALMNYVDEAYIDAPESDDAQKSYFAFEISVAIEMSRAFGLPIDFWSRHPVRRFIRWLTGRPSPTRIPLKILFQLRKAQRQMDVPNAIMSNASDRLLADGLAAMNRRSRSMAEYEKELAGWKPGDWAGPAPRFEI